MSNEKNKAKQQLLVPTPPSISECDLELGEYLLHIYVQVSQGLKIENSINALLSLKAFDQTKISKVHNNVLPQVKSFWGEHFFVNHTFTSRSELENANFELSLLDHNMLFKNSKIGSTSMSCSKIISSEDSTIFDQWSILTNSEKEIFSPMGFIKFSVNFVRAGSPRTNLERDFDPKQSTNALENLSLPPEIVLKQKQITVSIFRGERIIKLDTFGKGADPYVKLDMGGMKLKSKFVKNSLSPVFSEKLLLPAIFPTIVESLMLKFKDHDSLGSNDYIGCHSFKLDKIVRGDYAQPKWQYFYGARPDAEQEQFREQMNQIPEIASTFKGALLMSIQIKESPNPVFAVKPMTGLEVQKCKNEIVDVEFHASFFLEYIQNFRSEPEKHKICVSWGGEVKQTKDLVYQMGVLLIHQELSISQKFGIPKYLMEEYQICPSNDLIEKIMSCIPDIVVTGVMKDKHIIFYRIKPSRYLINPPNESQSHELKMHADQSVSSLQENYSGILRLKLNCGLKSQFDNYTPMWVGNAALQRVQYKKIKIVCHLFQGKNLLSSDSNGSSDPLVQFYNFGSTIQSAVFPKTLNPIWNQRLVLDSWMIGNSIPSTIINVWDKDQDWKGSGDFEYLGYAFVPMSGKMVTLNDFGKVPSPSWHEICLGKGNKSGKILMSFQVVPQSHFRAYDQFRSNSRNFSKIPVKKSLHHIKINVLGLRNLESTGLFPIKNASLKFATSSLKAVESMGGGAMFTDLIAMSKTSGSNPSIGSVLSLSAEIPGDIKIMPVISCSALENGLKLFGSQQIIGTFSINLGMFTLITLQNVNKKLKLLQQKYSDEEDAQIVSEIEQVMDYIGNSITHFGDQVEAGDAIEEEEEEDLKNHELQGSGIFQTFHIHKKVQKEENEVEGLNTDMENDMRAFMNETNGVPEIEMVNNKYTEQQVEIENEFMQEFNLMKHNNKPKKRNPELTFEEDEEEEQEEEQVKQFSLMQFNKKIIKQVKKIKFKVAQETKVVIEADEEEFQKDSMNIPGFVELGYASVSENNKHFRKFVHGELENSEYMGEDMFFSLNINRGKKINFKPENIFQRIFASKEEKFKNVGKFKGNIEVMSDDLLNRLGNLSVPNEVLDQYQVPHQLETFKYNKVDREILKGVTVLIRVYIIDALFNSSNDVNSENDSYICFEMDGHKTQVSRKVHNNNSPKFFTIFALEHTLPGASDLKIKFYDSDTLKADEFIGETVIDIERRFFDKQWRSFSEHPIETRSIYHPSSSVDVGVCRMFVEAYDMKGVVPPPRLINPRPTMKVEVRLVVWNVWGVPAQDFEDVSDLYVKASLPAFDTSMKTDTHYRAQGGFGSFNWRMKFVIEIDEYFHKNKADLALMLYDKDLLSKNDFVASVTINIADLIEQCLYYQKNQHYIEHDENGKESHKFVKKMILKKHNEEESEDDVKIKLSIDCVTLEEAEQSPVGIGRGDPNQNPYLEEPIGRFKWSLNPFDILNQMVGPQFRKKFWVLICVLFLLFGLLLTIPIFFSEVIARSFERLFGLV